MTAGMLHDIGSLAIYKNMPEQATEALIAADGDEEVLAIIESELMGFNHAEVGAELLRIWNFPEWMVEAVGCHHNPDKAETAVIEASILYLASIVANRIDDSTFVEWADPDSQDVDPFALEMTGLTEKDVEDAVRFTQSDLYRARGVYEESSGEGRV